MTIDRDHVAEDLAFERAFRLIQDLRDTLASLGIDGIARMSDRDGRLVNTLSLIEEKITAEREVTWAARIPLALHDNVRIIKRDRNEKREIVRPLARVGTKYAGVLVTPSYESKFDLGTGRGENREQSLHPHDLARIHRWLGKGRKAAKAKRPLSPAAP